MKALAIETEEVLTEKPGGLEYVLGTVYHPREGPYAGWLRCTYRDPAGVEFYGYFDTASQDREEQEVWVPIKSRSRKSSGAAASPCGASGVRKGSG